MTKTKTTQFESGSNVFAPLDTFQDRSLVSSSVFSLLRSSICLIFSRCLCCSAKTMGPHTLSRRLVSDLMYTAPLCKVFMLTLCGAQQQQFLRHRRKEKEPERMALTRSDQWGCEKQTFPHQRGCVAAVQVCSGSRSSGSFPSPRRGAPSSAPSFKTPKNTTSCESNSRLAYYKVVVTQSHSKLTERRWFASCWGTPGPGRSRRRSDPQTGCPWAGTMLASSHLQISPSMCKKESGRRKKKKKKRLTDVRGQHSDLWVWVVPADNASGLSQTARNNLQIERRR